MSPTTCVRQSPPFTTLGVGLGEAANKMCNLNVVNQQYVYFFSVAYHWIGKGKHWGERN